MIFNLINYNYSANNSANRLSQIVHWNALNAKLLLVNSCLSCPSSWRPADTLVCVITRLRVVIVGQALRRTREASRRVTTPSTLVWSVQFASRLRMSINRYCVTPNMSTCRPAAAAGRVCRVAVCLVNRLPISFFDRILNICIYITLCSEKTPTSVFLHNS